MKRNIVIKGSFGGYIRIRSLNAQCANPKKNFSLQQLATASNNLQQLAQALQ